MTLLKGYKRIYPHFIERFLAQHIAYHHVKLGVCQPRLCMVTNGIDDDRVVAFEGTNATQHPDLLQKLSALRASSWLNSRIQVIQPYFKIINRVMGMAQRWQVGL